MTKITTVGELKELLNNLDDDFKLRLMLCEKIDDSELANMSYPYPYNYTELHLEFGDVSYSDRELRLVAE